MKGYNLLLNTIAALVIGLAIIGLLLLTLKSLKTEPSEIKTIKIEYHIKKTDSTFIENNTEILKIDSLLNEIQKTSNFIQNRQLELVKDKEDDTFFNKLYAAIVAIILAIAGFFGFKSTNDIRSRAIEEAKKESSNIAKEVAKESAIKEFNTTFDQEYKGEVFKQATKASNEVLRDEIGSLEKTLDKFHKRLDKLELKNIVPTKDSSEGETSDQENNVESDDEPENPFNDEK